MIFSWKKPYDVVFYYPQHFNRGKNNTNPFFDPLIEVCEKYGLRYKVLEEPDSKTKKPKNPKAFDFSFLTYLIQIFRYLIPKFFFKTFREKEKFIGFCISILTLNRFKAKNYITISNAKVNFLTGLNKNSRVIDLQHGVIYSFHPGYFHKDSCLLDELTDKRIFFMVFGKSYAEMFFKNHSNFRYDIKNRVKVIGTRLGLSDVINIEKKFITVLYSLQMTADFGIEKVLIEKNNLILFLKDVNSFFIENQFKRYVFYSDSINLKKFKNKNVIVEVKKLYETKPTNYILNKIGERNNLTYYKAEVSNIILNNNYDETLNETETAILNQYLLNKTPFDNFNIKKFIFIRGNGTNIITKDDFFQEINKSISKYGEIKGTYCYEFSDTEKNENGGFDGMIIIWSKLNMSETRKEKILKLLPKIIKTN